MLDLKIEILKMMDGHAKLKIAIEYKDKFKGPTFYVAYHCNITTVSIQSFASSINSCIILSSSSIGQCPIIAPFLSA